MPRPWRLLLSAGFALTLAPAAEHRYTWRTRVTTTTLIEIDRGLPNGFHDSRVRSCNLDFVARTATFGIDVWVGDAEATTPNGRELYRSALLVVSGLAFCQLDAPDPSYPYQEAMPIRVDLSEADQTVPAIRELPAGVFAVRFYVSGWNSFIHVAGRHAQLAWSDGQLA